MPITPTELARVSRQSTSWPEAKRRVISAYREWIRAAPGIQSMYSVPFPVSVVRTRIRQEFERHRFINKLPVVDVLLFQSSADYQETMNYWRQTSHIMAYFTDETFKKGPKLPASFMEGFLEGRN